MPLPEGLSHEEKLEEMGVMASSDEATEGLHVEEALRCEDRCGEPDLAQTSPNPKTLPYPHALRVITRRDPDCLTGKEKGLRITVILSAESEEEMRLWHGILLAAKAEAEQHAIMASRFDWSAFAAVSLSSLYYTYAALPAGGFQ